MKKILFLLLLSIGTYAQTTKRITADMNLQTELNNAVDGDIFMVEAGNYGNIDVSKKVTLIGPGYANTQTTSLGAALLGDIHFKASAAGSWMVGMQTGHVSVSANNIAILRNYTKTIRLGVNEANSDWSGVANNVIVKQNIAERLEILAHTSPGQVSNFSVKNNLFSWGFHLEGVINGEIINNTFDYNLSGEENPAGTGFRQSYISQEPFHNYSSNCGKLNIVFKNNIMSNIGTFDGAWCPIINYPTDVFKNNILQTNSSVPSINIPGNTTITDLSTLYLGYPNNPNDLVFDARNQLAPNSPAKGAGEGGTDCGAFGGDEPYILSGVPFVPSITTLIVPQTTSQNGTLNIQIKAKTNN